MFIKKIILNNFRIFRGKHEFDFSNKKIIIIEGPNGHGKSTVFDAINWTISGKISRYMGSSEYQQFNYIINSDAYLNNVNEASVEISLDCDDEIIIKRVINRNGTTKLFINNQQFGLREGQKKIIQLLANNSITSDDKLLDSIDLLSFIESTLILSQENLEDFVRGNKPTERYLKLEQILGLTRYGQDFKVYLQDLIKEYVLQKSQIDNNKKDINYKRELLNAEYIPKLQQSTTEGIKSKEEILSKINLFYNKFRKSSFKSLVFTGRVQEITLVDYENLSNYIESIENQLKKLDFNKFEIENKEIFVNQVESLNKIEKYKKNIQEFNRKRLNRENGLKKAGLIKDQLRNISLTNEYLNNKKNEKNKIDLEIKNINKNIEIIYKNIDVKHTNFTDEKISAFIEKFDSNNIRLKNLIDKVNILEKERKLDEINSKLKISEKSNDLKSKHLQEMQSEINLIENKILDLTNQKNSNLETRINSIIHEVQTHLIKSDEQNCLVCGTKFENNNMLKNSIYTQIKISEKLLSTYEIELNNLKVKQNDLNLMINMKKEEIKILQQKLKKLKKETNDLEKGINVLRLNNSIQIENIEEINKDIVKIQSYIQSNNNTYLGFTELRKGKKIINDLEKELKEIIEEEKIVLSRHVKLNSYVNNQTKLQLKLNKMEKYIGAANEKLNEYDKQILQLNKDIQNIEMKLSQLFKIKNELANMIDLELEMDSTEILAFIFYNINLLKDRIFEGRSLLKTVKRYLDEITLRDIEIKIKNYDEMILLLNSQLNKFNNVDDQLKELLDYHTKVQSSLINEYLNDISLEINNYFRQISPHSYFNYINLITKKNELFILLKNNLTEIVDVESDIENSVNASLTLSAAQSTILAMSIFLALNKSQNWSRLNVIGIDDPFQNLDDINAYSFIDVLSNLVLVENRQIFISTHDSDFARLTLNKMNLNSDKCGYIKIQSYTKEAIEIESEQYKLIK